MTSAYVAIGGSNTCGHEVSRGKSFRELFGRYLVEGRHVDTILNHCTPAMGPKFAATCSKSSGAPEVV